MMMIVVTMMMVGLWRLGALMVPVAWMMAALLMGGVAVTLDLLRRALRASLQQDIYIQEAPSGPRHLAGRPLGAQAV